jgi:hypothetical protein
MIDGRAVFGQRGGMNDPGNLVQLLASDGNIGRQADFAIAGIFGVLLLGVVGLMVGMIVMDWRFWFWPLLAILRMLRKR